MPVIRISNFGPGGLASDKINNGLSPGQWSKLEEIDIRSDFLASGTGYLMLDPTGCPVDPHYMFQLERVETGYTVVSDGVDTYLWDGVTYHSLASGWAGGRVTFCTFLGTLIVNSYTDGPWYWSGNVGEALLALPGWPANYLCLRMVAFQNFLVAIHQDRPTDATGEGAYRVAWSDTAGAGQIPNEWVPAPENSAGSRVLPDTTGHLYAAARMRDKLILYKADSAYAMAPRADNLIFDIQRIDARIGCDVYDGVAEYGGVHAVLTRGDLVLFDGQSAKSVAVEKVREQLFDALSKTEWNNSRVLALYPRSEIWLMLKSEGSPDYDVLLKFDVEYNSFSTNRLKNATGWAIGAPDADAFSLGWDASPAGDDSWDDGAAINWNISQYNASRDDVIFGGRIWIPGATPEDADIVSHRELWRTIDGTYTDQYGRPQNAIAEKSGMVISEIGQRILVKRIYPEMDGNTTVLISLGIQDQAGDRILWGSPRRFRAGKDRYVNVRGIGQPLAVRVQSLGVEQVDAFTESTPEDARYWKLLALTFEWQPAGKR